MTKHIYTFSPVYLALAISGAFSSNSHAQDIECKKGEILKQHNISLRNCVINNLSEQDRFYVLKVTDSKDVVIDNLTIDSYLTALDIHSSKVDIKNSNIKSISGKSDFTPSFINTLSINDNSDVNVENSIISSIPTNPSQFNVQVNNSNLTVSNSTFRMQKDGNNVGEAAAALYVHNNGTAVVRDTTFDLDARSESFIVVGNGGKVILDKGL